MTYLSVLAEREFLRLSTSSGGWHIPTPLQLPLLSSNFTRSMLSSLDDSLSSIADSVTEPSEASDNGESDSDEDEERLPSPHGVSDLTKRLSAVLKNSTMTRKKISKVTVFLLLRTSALSRTRELTSLKTRSKFLATSSSPHSRGFIHHQNFIPPPTRCPYPPKPTIGLDVVLLPTPSLGAFSPNSHFQSSWPLSYTSATLPLPIFVLPTHLPRIRSPGSRLRVRDLTSPFPLSGSTMSSKLTATTRTRSISYFKSRKNKNAKMIAVEDRSSKLTTPSYYSARSSPLGKLNASLKNGNY